MDEGIKIVDQYDIIDRVYLPQFRVPPKLVLPMLIAYLSQMHSSKVEMTVDNSIRFEFNAADLNTTLKKEDLVQMLANLESPAKDLALTDDY